MDGESVACFLLAVLLAVCSLTALRGHAKNIEALIPVCRIPTKYMHILGYTYMHGRM